MAVEVGKNVQESGFGAAQFDEASRAVTDALGERAQGLMTVAREFDRPHELMARYRDRLASGSYAVLSHGTVEEAPEATKAMFAAATTNASPT